MLAREELGLNPDDLGSPWRAAAASFVTFAVGAAVPLVPVPRRTSAARARIAAAAVLTRLALFAVGLGLSLFTGRQALRSALRMVLIGGGAGLVSFLWAARSASPSAEAAALLEIRAAGPRLARLSRYRYQVLAMKRIFLFLVTNLAVVLVSDDRGAHLLGLDHWLAMHGSSLGGLLVFAAVFGFGGSFISLLMSKWMAKRMPWACASSASPATRPSNGCSRVVAAATRAPPASACRKSASSIRREPNAFATGASRNAALVAVSSGLLAAHERARRSRRCWDTR